MCITFSFLFVLCKWPVVYGGYLSLPVIDNISSLKISLFVGLKKTHRVLNIMQNNAQFWCLDDVYHLSVMQYKCIWIFNSRKHTIHTVYQIFLINAPVPCCGAFYRFYLIHLLFINDFWTHWYGYTNLRLLESSVCILCWLKFFIVFFSHKKESLIGGGTVIRKYSVVEKKRRAF